MLEQHAPGAALRPRERSGDVVLVVLLDPEQLDRVRGRLVGVVVLLLLIKGAQIATMISTGKKMMPPPETVTSAMVKEEDWAPTLRVARSSCGRPARSG